MLEYDGADMPAYPAYYLVNDRPVKLVLTPGGGLDALVFDWKSGAFLPDRSYFAKVSEVGIGKDVDSLTEGEFGQRVLELRRPIVRRLIEAPRGRLPTMRKPLIARPGTIERSPCGSTTSLPNRSTR